MPYYNKHNLRICTWNVQTLNRTNGKQLLISILDEYKADITALQELRWIGRGHLIEDSCDIYYSCHPKYHTLGVGFVIGNKLRRGDQKFIRINERLAIIRIKIKNFSFSLICVHAHANTKNDTTKEAFYDELEKAYDSCPGQDIKIVLGDFNAQVGKEGVFGSTVGKFSFYEKTNNNGMKLINFANAHNMIICNTRFEHPDKHKITWKHPNGKLNQNDYVLIDGRYASSILDVRTMRGANDRMNSDHYLVVAKFRPRRSKKKKQYFKERKEQKRLFRTKNGEALNADFEEIEFFRNRKEIQQFCAQLMRNGNKLATIVARDFKNGKHILDIWKDHFSNNLPDNRYINDEFIQKTSIAYLGEMMSNFIELINYTDERSPELNEIVSGLTQPTNEAINRDKDIRKIWLVKHMPRNWNINQMHIVYKCVVNNLSKILRPHVNEAIKPYQWLLQTDRSIMDQIFRVRQILEKTTESHHLLVDFKLSFDNTMKQQLYEIMSELRMPKKLIRLCQMTLHFYNIVETGNDHSESFDNKINFLEDFVNLILTRLVRKPNIERFSKNLLIHADHIYIIGDHFQIVQEIFENLHREFLRVGLIVNENKTKYMLATKKTTSQLWYDQVKIGRYRFRNVKELIYMGTILNNTNDISLEIMRRITLANKCYFMFYELLISKSISQRTKTKLYNSIVLPVLLYGAEAWTLTKQNKSMLKWFESRILRKIYGQNQSEQELYKSYKDIDIITRIQSARISWFRYVKQLERKDLLKCALYKDYFKGERKTGRWLNQVYENIRDSRQSNF